MESKFDTQTDLIRKGLVLEDLDIKRRPLKGDSRSFKLKKGNEKFSLFFDALRVLNYKVSEVEDYNLMEQTRWRLPIYDQPLTIHRTLNIADLDAKVKEKGLDKINKDVSEEENIRNLESFLSKEFKYNKQKQIKGLSRFETSAKTLEGVCQDVNFFFWHYLRKNNIASYLAVGFVGIDGEIKTTSGHAVVYAYDKHNKKWNMYDATPIRESKERESSTWKLPSFGFNKDKKITIKTRMQKIREKISTTYKNVKKTTYNAMVETEVKLMKGKISEINYELVRIHNNKKYVEEQKRAKSIKRHILSKINSGTKFIYSMKNIPVNTEGVPQIGKITKLFNPKNLTKNSKELKYINNCLPEYFKRMNFYSSSESAILETINTQGQLWPFNNNSSEWEKVIRSTFGEFAPNPEPEFPTRTSSPRQYIFERFPQKTIEEIDGTITKTKPPKGTKKVLASENPKVYSKGEFTEMSVVENVYFGDKVQPREWYAQKSVVRNLKPSVNHYTLSQEIRNFDETMKLANENEWLELAEIIQDYIEAGEHPLSHLYYELLFDQPTFSENYQNKHNLRIEYVDE